MTKHIICDIVFYIFLRYNMKDKLHDNIQDNFSNLDDEILDLCKRYDISIRISDYSESLPSLKKQYDKVYKKVEKTASGKAMPDNILSELFQEVLHLRREV